MDDASPPTHPQRSARERLELTPAGETAARAYLEGVVAARAVGGRRAFETACEAWAAQHRLRAAHAQLLSELLGAPMTRRQLADKVHGYGATSDEVRDGIAALTLAGMIATR